MSEIKKGTFELSLDEDGELDINFHFEDNLINPDSEDFKSLSETEQILNTYLLLMIKGAVEALENNAESIEIN